MNRFLLSEDPFFSLTTNGTPEPASAGCGRWRDAPFDVHTRRFFGSGGQGLLTRRVEYPMYELPQLHQAVADCFADWRLLAEGGGPAVTDALWTPQTTRIRRVPNNCQLVAHGTPRREDRACGIDGSPI